MNDGKIYVDATSPATLHDGYTLLNFPTLRVAILAWFRLPAEQRKKATIKVFGKDGALYTAVEIERLHH